MEKLKKTKSYFTIKEKRHQRTDDGTIFERDYMTLNSLGDWAGKTFPYGDGNFKMLTGNKYNVTRKHNFGKWAKTEDGDIIWNYDDLDKVSQNTNIQESTEIKTNPNKTSLLSFAYYGSCTEAIKNTIKSIITKFPGELYVGQEFMGETIEEINGKCIVENPFGIDIISDSGSSEILKNFADSSKKYEVIDNLGQSIGTVAWSVEHNDRINVRCLKEGDLINTITILDNFIIKEMYYGGNRILITEKEYQDYHVRLNNETINELFGAYTDLERILLNLESKPLYTATLDYPHEDEETGKIVTYQKKFTWPTDGGWNLDIESGRYEQYLTDLLDLAGFYDEYYTDNIWRSMTHDAIKNMDRTFIDERADEDDYSDGISRMEALLHSYGHFFDQFKFTIDSLKNRKKVSYEGNNNTPDYFLIGENELSGWDTTNPISTLNSVKVPNINFSGLSKIFENSDAYKQFLVNLKLNSKSILSKKGTRQGIEELLSLFGMESEDHAKDKKNADYTITEYVTVMKYKDNSAFEVGINESFPIEELNKLKKSYPDEMDGYYEDTLEGLPVRIVYGKEKKYIVPWFFTGSTLDGEPYFQMYGGWGKRYRIDVETEDGIISLGKGVFEETEKYLKYVSNIDALEDMLISKVNNGDIFYVSDVTDYKEASSAPNSVSNYFICINVNEIGNIEKGWRNIPLEDISKGSGKGATVLYLESIIDEIKGNNPHVGFGKYDDGSEYYEIFKQLFKYSIENDNFNDAAYSCNDGSIDSAILQAGFAEANVLVRDNSKCWYFRPDENNEGNKKLVCVNQKETTFNNGNEKYVNGEAFFISDVNPFDYETKKTSSREMASYSVMNTKRMEIHFLTDKFKGNEQFIADYKLFINEDVLPYLKQMIPSTTIWWVRIGDEKFSANAQALDVVSTAKKYKVDGVIIKDTVNEDNLKTFKYRKKINSLTDR